MASTKKTVTAKIILYKNTKATVCLRDTYTDFFNIFTGVLQTYTLARFDV